MGLKAQKATEIVLIADQQTMNYDSPEGLTKQHA